MRRLSVCLSCLAVLAIVVVPVIAQSNHAGTTNENAPAARSLSVASLVDALAKKGVLTPAEANAIRNAAPETELQLLVETLTRKGVLNAGDMSVTAAPAAGHAPALLPLAVPVPQPELVVLKPVAPPVVPAIDPLRGT